MPLNDAVMSLRGALTALHPEGRRWLKFLRSFTLAPDALPRPAPPPGPRDFIICGAPRTGTTLVSAMLFQPPRVVTVMEPWAGMQLPPAPLFASLRDEIAQTEQLRSGRLDLDALMRSGTVKRVPEGTSMPRVEVEHDYLLGVKWPAFWQYLELLPDTKFLVCVRHPHEVVASFKRMGGRLGLGLEYDLAFNRRLNQQLRLATRHLALRRILLYDYINGRIIPHLRRPNVYLVRYERWLTEPEALLQEIGAFLGTVLGSRPARIERPRREAVLSLAETAMIAEHCHTAALLGYDSRSAIPLVQQRIPQT